MRPRGARPDIAAVAYGLGSVSIHAPAWGATRHCYSGPSARCVSIHAPAWGATILRGTAMRCPVSIHAPAWGATEFWQRHCLSFLVSIHAPAWGATGKHHVFYDHDVVSIHAPAWGATMMTRPCLPRRLVSIHAPAWGATGQSLAQQLRVTFQSTRPRGARQFSLSNYKLLSMFQSTRPRGARLYVFNHQKFCSITKPFSTNLPKRSLRKRHSFSSKIICNIISNCCCLREPSGFLGGLEVLASENQCSLGIIRRFCAYMFDVPPPLIPKDIKAQAVLRFIHFFHKGCS